MLHCALEPLFGALPEPTTIFSITQYHFLQLMPPLGATIQPSYVLARININIPSGEKIKNEMVSIAHLNPCLVPSLRAIHYLQQCTGLFTAACATSGCNDPAVV